MMHVLLTSPNVLELSVCILAFFASLCHAQTEVNPNSFPCPTYSEITFSSCGSLSDMGIKALSTSLTKSDYSPALSLSVVNNPPTEIISRCCFVPSNKVSLKLNYLESVGYLHKQNELFLLISAASVQKLQVHANKLFSLI